VGVVRDGAGAPVEGAMVEVHASAAEGEAEPRTTTTDAEGRWRLEGVPVGPARVVVRREGADPVEVTVEVAAGAEPAEIATQLGAALPQGELRGTIQGSDGRPLAGASIRILPIGVERTTDADGAFEAEVPPGQYEVEVRAPGHRAQTRRVEVVEQGVVLLNAQLLRSR
jgi:protocatechuate 3,4-dioxygenase beta subunit